MSDPIYLVLILQSINMLIFWISVNHGVYERLRFKHSKTFINKTNARNKLCIRFFYLQWKNYLPLRWFIFSFVSSVMMLLSTLISFVYGCRYIMNVPLYTFDRWLVNVVIVFIYIFWIVKLVLRIFDKIFF